MALRNTQPSPPNFMAIQSAPTLPHPMPVSAAHNCAAHHKAPDALQRIRSLWTAPYIPGASLRPSEAISARGGMTIPALHVMRWCRAKVAQSGRRSLTNLTQLYCSKPRLCPRLRTCTNPLLASGTRRAIVHAGLDPQPLQQEYRQQRRAFRRSCHPPQRSGQNTKGPPNSSPFAKLQTKASRSSRNRPLCHDSA